MSEEKKAKAIIEVKELDLFYGDFQALKKIDTVIEKNKVSALIGPSGCGKSTFLRTLNRMNDLISGVTTRGAITFEGREIYDEDLDVVALRRKIGMVFQKPNPFPKSIYENVAYGPRRSGVKNKKDLDQIVKESLQESALWEEVKDRLDKSALGLSGGQQQRLCIARALAMKPQVLLMDEPTSALDPIATNRIEELITHLKKDYTIVIVTHSMHQAARISDKTAFFLMGELIEQGETDKIFTTPEDQRTEDYVTGRFG